MEWLGSFIQTMFDGIWGLFSIKWPGFDFTFGHVFIAVFLASGSLAVILKMVGVNIVDTWSLRGGNNDNIKIPEERRIDRI